MITIEQIKELMAKATPGKWLLKDSIYAGLAVFHEFENGNRRLITNSGELPDCELISALPEIAQLCLDQAEEIERLREFEWKYNDLCK